MPSTGLHRIGRDARDVNVGVIGAGMIGQDHIRRLTHVLSGVRVAAVTDVNLDRAARGRRRRAGSPCTRPARS